MGQPSCAHVLGIRIVEPASIHMLRLASPPIIGSPTVDGGGGPRRERWDGRGLFSAKWGLPSPWHACACTCIVCECVVVVWVLRGWVVRAA